MEKNIIINDSPINPSSNVGEDSIELARQKQNTFVEQLWYRRNEMPLDEKLRAFIIVVLSIGTAVFHLWTSVMGLLPSWQHRAVHVGLVLCLCFIVKQVGKTTKTKLLYDWVPFVLSGILLAYMYFQYPGSEYRQGAPNINDLIFGTLLIVLIILATLRTNGIAMAAILVIGVSYFFLGPYLPGLIGHKGFTYDRMIDEMFLSARAIFGAPIYTSSTVLVLFVIFGTMLSRSGAADTFVKLASAVAGNLTGGPALTSVLSSSLIGTVIGAGAANVAITGPYTIPLMKNVGYKPKFAAGVVAASSQGCQISPPILGAAAFIIADTLGVSYWQVVKHSIFPAVFYYFACTVSVILVAKREKLATIPKERLPKISSVLKHGWYHLLPLFVIVYLLFTGSSPMKCGFYAIVITFLLSFVRKETRFTLPKLLASLEDGVRSVIIVAIACAAAGIIVGSVSMTGLGQRFARLAIQLSQGQLFPLLLLTMTASIIIGLGLPTVSCYVLVAALTAPALIRLGVTPITAHFFAFYFGIISGITPPVAITSYAAAGLARCDPNEAAIESVKLALGGFIIPFLFVYNPPLMLIGTGTQIFASIITTLIGCFSFVCAIQGYVLIKTTMIERIMLFGAAFGTFITGIATDLVGIALITIVIIMQQARRKNQAQLKK